VVLVDRSNHHLFQPLLYQVASAALSTSEIGQPIHSIMRGARNVSVRLDEAIGVDLPGRRFLLAGGNALLYDTLVVATRVNYDYFGHPDWAAHAPSLKTAADAIEIRRRLLLAFEEAEKADDPERRRQLLTFVLVRAGPTGVEMAGSIAELARFVLRRDFRNIDPASARVILLEAGPRMLSAFPEKLSAYTLNALRRMRVEVRLSTPVESIDANGVAIGDERIEAGLVIWCAGVRGSSPGSWLGIPPTRRCTVPVSPNLSVPGHPEVFVVGDLAHVPEQNGAPLPQLATVRQAAGGVRRPRHQRPSGRKHAAGRVGFSQPRLARNHRPLVCGRRSGLAAPDRLARMARLGLRAYLFPDRVSQPDQRVCGMGVGVVHVQPRSQVVRGSLPLTAVRRDQPGRSERMASTPRRVAIPASDKSMRHGPR
jgi:NADH dehydrogenase